VDCGISIRTLVVGSDTHVVVLAGALDEAAAPAVGAALQRSDGHHTIVDLLDVTHIDRTGALTLDRSGVLVVADRPTLRALTAASARRHQVYERLTDAIADAL
jgi:hypothetical protein